MNWGGKIVLGLATFMLFIIGAGIYMVTNDGDSLLEDDYYEKSLTYDDVYTKKQNLLDDKAVPAVKVEHDTLMVTFSKENNKGMVKLIKPSDNKADKTFPFYTTDTLYRLPVLALAKGNWTLELDWESDGKAYIHSQSIFIP